MRRLSYTSLIGVCRLDLDDQVPDHSTFSVNRHGRFRNSAIFRKLFEAVVRACISADSSRARGSRSMRASWKPMQAVITVKRQARLTRRPRAPDACSGRVPVESRR